MYLLNSFSIFSTNSAITSLWKKSILTPTVESKKSSKKESKSMKESLLDEEEPDDSTNPSLGNTILKDIEQFRHTAKEIEVKFLHSDFINVSNLNLDYSI